MNSYSLVSSVSALRAVPVVLLGLGAFLLADAVRTGGATLHLVLVVPVFTGGSAEFIAGAFAIFVGIATLPLLFGANLAHEPTPSPGPPPSSGVGSGGGGLILLGPVPIFFGSWRAQAPHWYWIAVAVGTALLVVALILIV